MSAPPLLLGIDLGTSSLKALLVELDGSVAGAGSAEYPIDAPQPGFAEQDPEAWWRAACSAVRQAVAPAAGRTIAAIGLSGQMHGTVLLDTAGGLLAPAIIWPDQRSRRQVESITAQVGAAALVQEAGSPVATGFMAATLLWLREERPSLFGGIGHCLLPKDWLRFRMTGAVATDPSDASAALLMDVARRTWSDTLLGLVGIRRGQLPPLQASTAVAGALQPESAAALGLPPGIPVITGAADQACALLGAGATDSTTIVVNLSTGGQIVRPAAAPDADAQGRMHTFCSAFEAGGGPPWYQMGATLNVGLALRWLRTQVLGAEGADAYDRMTAGAATVNPGADGLIFLPYLVGERTPHMDPQARAAFLGLTLTHGQAHLVRAVLEGATFACYDALRVLLEAGAAGDPTAAPERIVLAGGGARSALWQQIVADVFGMPVQRLLVGEQSALGAALLAGSGVGALDLAQAAPAWAQTAPPVAPASRAHSHYRALFPLYQQAFRANRDLMHALGDFAGGVRLAEATSRPPNPVQARHTGPGTSPHL